PRGTGATLLGRPGAVRAAWGPDPEGVGAGHSTVGRERDNRTPPEGRPGSRIAQRKEDRSVSVEETNPSGDRTTVLQSKLYQAAQREPARRFHALYDKLFLGYILQSAWELVRRNDGAAGVDQQTLGEIEAL